ncbi:hypothetical protein [Cellulosimicrobium marinum]|uniref:hypothetical protein n=1 Tax=Cellulosimicrobium marinum TaxID=1638992 RepID=UPI001E5AF469|nr:hypothetical protein [Cellulosimicrobium marinum]MCB7135553.1 hypothetical protein [Cellulosimicrobium marinum]
MNPVRDLRQRTPRHTAAALAAAALLAPTLGACAALGATSGTESCVDWVSFDTAADREAAATLVVDATVLRRDGTRPMLGTDAHVWEVEVTDVVHGDATPGDRLAVASTPQTCSDGTYPDGDPLDVDHAVRLYLADGDHAVPGTAEGWSLITPFDGVGAAG